ncbi:hypothetical protein TSMEX_011168 [Taenia solium]|eukprot:TsM_000271200 transcript=TsM_000271200 gene=TsM_000271200
MSFNQEKGAIKEYYERLKNIYKKFNRQYETIVLKTTIRKRAGATASEMETKNKKLPSNAKISSHNHPRSSSSSSSSSYSFVSYPSSPSSSPHNRSTQARQTQTDLAKMRKPSQHKASANSRNKNAGKSRQKPASSQPQHKRDSKHNPSNSKTSYIAADAQKRRSHSKHH